MKMHGIRVFALVAALALLLGADDLHAGWGWFNHSVGGSGGGGSFGGGSFGGGSWGGYGSGGSWGGYGSSGGFASGGGSFGGGAIFRRPILGHSGGIFHGTGPVRRLVSRIRYYHSHGGYGSSGGFGSSGGGSYGGSSGGVVVRRPIFGGSSGIYYGTGPVRRLVARIRSHHSSGGYASGGGFGSGGGSTGYTVSYSAPVVSVQSAPIHESYASPSVVYESPSVVYGDTSSSCSCGGEIVSDGGIVSDGYDSEGSATEGTVSAGGVSEEVTSEGVVSDGGVIDGPVENHDSLPAESLDNPSGTTPITPATDVPAVDGEADQLPGVDARRPSHSAVLSVVVPRDARVYVNGNLTTTRGYLRRYVADNLKAGKTYTYEVRAVLHRNGKKLAQTQFVKLSDHQDGEAAFTFDEVDALATTLTLHVPADAQVELAGKLTTTVGQTRTFRTHHLESGQTWDGYQIVVTVRRDGRKLTQERMLSIRGGEAYDLVINVDEMLVASR